MKYPFALGALRACVAGICLGAALPGCSTLGLSGEKASWSTLTLSASDDANNNSPVAVDVVLVADEAMLARVAELPGSKWFASRAGLAAAFPKSIRYRSWEVVPGQRLEVSGETFAGPRVKAAFVFADYPDSGAHCVRIETFSGRLVVRLDDHAFTVSTAQ
jgi:type VI secretion system protein